MQEAQAGKNQKPGGKPEQVKVTVSFPLAGRGPYKEDYKPEATSEIVRGAALAHFGVVDDQTTSYYLSHKGDRVESSSTVGDLADEARAVKFTLAKELIQG